MGEIATRQRAEAYAGRDGDLEAHGERDVLEMAQVLQPTYRPGRCGEGLVRIDGGDEKSGSGCGGSGRRLEEVCDYGNIYVY
jgi:hypothetical protein